MFKELVISVSLFYTPNYLSNSQTNNTNEVFNTKDLITNKDIYDIKNVMNTMFENMVEEEKAQESNIIIKKKD